MGAEVRLHRCSWGLPSPVLVKGLSVSPGQPCQAASAGLGIVGLYPGLAVRGGGGEGQVSHP